MVLQVSKRSVDPSDSFYIYPFLRCISAHQYEGADAVIIPPASNELGLGHASAGILESRSQSRPNGQTLHTASRDMTSRCIYRRMSLWVRAFTIFWKTGVDSRAKFTEVCRLISESRWLFWKSLAANPES